ncbi:calcium-binding protein [Dolichospermum flos-aquae]|uniref:Calcium-binding protein n=1 Tax=Dolichospermum flos-aquae CCAP 1403/13F TaxID=315271 RepID=A0A6H2BX99_DOLFA|nr:calcium-binding protein [Dolichospermum flos-aquae]QJB43660.1 calcium-binding protein [Dolichospermum flos-aquae CCAP 1403/13F]
MANTPFDTTQPSQVKGLNGYTVDPIFTVGDKIGNYVAPGILDGIGAYSLNDTTVRVLVVNEVAATDGYKYTLKNGTQLPGARVNYFDVDKRTLQIVNAGLAHDTIINRKGEVVDAATDLEFGGIQRFCSAALFEANQFGAGIGLADRIFFSGEETYGGTQFALDTKTNVLYTLPWFGRAAWENVTELNTGRTDKVAFLIGDDRGPAPLILYIGDKNAKNDGSFLDRNGLGQGKLYVWVADDPSNATDPIEADPREFKGTNNSTVGKFVEIKYYDPALANTAVDGQDSDTSIQNELGYDAQGFATQAQQDKLAADVKAFLFSRPEDVSTNPKDGTQVVLASTGRETIFDGVDTYGTTYKIDIDFNNINTGDISAKIDILFDGNLTKDASLRNPDNLDWADDGKIYFNEDRAATAAIFAGTSKEEASIWRIDPSVANPSSTLTRIGQIDRSAVPSGQTDPSPTDIGNWETSGILDVSTLFGNAPGTQFIFDVQAHSLRDGTIITATNIDGNGDGTRTRQENLVEGGQLSFLIAPNANLIQDTQFHAGTPNADTIVAKQTPGFGGINDVVFSGAGNDEIDSAAAGALAGNNIIDAGSGGDTVFLANGDRAFGSDGNDTFFGDEASNFRASGGAGNDLFFLGNGSNGRALGGDGNDTFEIGLGGGHTLSGGAGADQFWIVFGELTKATNTILDFQIGTDVIGISGAKSLGITTANLTLTQVGADTAVIFGGQTLATLTGIQASALSVANPNQFVLV